MNENNFIENNNIFSLGGFDVTANISPSGDASRAYQYGEVITLGSLSETASFFEQPIVQNLNVESLDLSNPKLYIKYSSFVELIRGSLENIIVSYPGSLYISQNIVGHSYGDINAIDISYDRVNDVTQLSILTNYLNNPGNIFYLSANENINFYKNFNKTYSGYFFELEDKAYPILSFIPSSKIKNDKITIAVKGQPFLDFDGNKRIAGYIRPSAAFLAGYLKQVSFFERYLLQESFSFLDTLEENGGVEYEYKAKFRIPKVDKYNYDFQGARYENFLTSLLNLATKYDEKYVNITARKLVPQSFQDISINSGNFPAYGKSNQLLNVFSFYFDELYANISALKYYDQVDYNENVFFDRKNIINLFSSLGFEIKEADFNAIDSNMLIPLVKNIPFLLNSKGTRNAVLSILNYLNIPDALIEFNETIYKYDSLDYGLLSYYYDILGFSLSDAPAKPEGTVDLLKNENIFHSDAYFSSLKNLLPDLEEYLLTVSKNIQYSDILANIEFNLSGDTLDFSLHNLNWSDLACYNYTGGTVNNPLPETFFDNCNCKIQLDDLSLQVCTTPIDPYASYCPPMFVDVVPNCVAIPQTGSTLSGNTVCDFNIELYSNEGNLNALQPLIPAPTNYISFPYELHITSCNADDDEAIVLEQQVTCLHYYNNDFALLSEGGYVSMIRLYDTISGTNQDLNLNPFTTPYLSGCSGNLNSSDLLFPSGTTQLEIDLWASNLEMLIENAICVAYAGLPLPPINGVTYFMSVEAFSDGSFNIMFNNKNAPVAPEYNIGINKLDANFSLFDGTSNHNSNSYFLTFNNLFLSFTGNTVCGELIIDKEIALSDLTALISANYNSIAFNTSAPIVNIVDNGSIQETNCLINGNLTGNTYSYGAYLNVNVYGGIPPYSLTGVTQGQFFNSGDTYSFFVEDSSCNFLHVTGEVLCNIDPCLGNTIIEKTRIIETEVEVPLSEYCNSIELLYQIKVTQVNLGNRTATFLYEHEITGFEGYEDIEVIVRVDYITAGSGSFNFSNNLTSLSGGMSLSYDPDPVQQTDFTVYVDIIIDGVCVYELNGGTLSLDPSADPNDVDSASIILANEAEGFITQIATVEETYYEIVNSAPVLSASYVCRENGDAIIALSVSGGTEPYVYYGASDGQLVSNGAQISAYAEDANGCRSNTVQLDIDCVPDLFECGTINLEASLETTSVDAVNDTATLTFTYSVTGLEFDEEVTSVSLVASGVGNTNNYILGSPVMKMFNGAFGAEQIYLDFSPNVLGTGTYKFIMVIKTENCTYSDIFEMSVDASILSNVDNYSNILT